MFKVGDRVTSDIYGVGYVVATTRKYVQVSINGALVTYECDGTSSLDYIIPYPRWHDIVESLFPIGTLLIGVAIGVLAYG